MSKLYELIQLYLACPHCQGRLTVSEQIAICQQCHFKGQIYDDVVVMMEHQESFFDKPFDSDSGGDEFLKLFRLQQEKILRDYLRSGTVVCDVGCGRMLQYHKPADCFVIGVDPSFSSINENKCVDLRVMGTAFSLPIPSESIDVVICFYSIHHMVGNTRMETYLNTMNVFKEISRVLKQSGNLFVFEVVPWPIAGALQDILWNGLRRNLSSQLDTYLWSSKALRELGCKIMSDKKITYEKFYVPAWKMLSPFLAFPKMKIPRFLIPVGLGVYHWHV